MTGIKAELQKMANSYGQGSNVSMQRNLLGMPGVMQNSENKIAFLLNILEPLIINDLNNEIVVAGGILETFVALIKTQEVKRAGAGLTVTQPPLKTFVKFALRCLTSSIRTEAAVGRVSNSLLSSCFFSSTGLMGASARS
jgi:hypothetical protein